MLTARQVRIWHRRWCDAQGMLVDARNAAGWLVSGELAGCVTATTLEADGQSYLQVGWSITDIPWLSLSETCAFGRPSWRADATSFSAPRKLAANDWAVDEDLQVALGLSDDDLLLDSLDRDDLERLLSLSRERLLEDLSPDAAFGRMRERWAAGDGAVLDHLLVTHAWWRPDQQRDVVRQAQGAGDTSLLFGTLEELRRCIAQHFPTCQWAASPQ